MKNRIAHINTVTFALLAFLACSQQTNANSYQFLRCYQECQKEARLGEEKTSPKINVSPEHKEGKKTKDAIGASFTGTQAPYSQQIPHFSWGETSLTKKAARTELSRFEIDQKTLHFMLFFRASFDQHQHFDILV